jgi:hypothetical protein
MRLKIADRRGSFLIEAMLAVVILSTALTILIRSFTAAITAVRVQQGYVKAIVLLHEELDAVVSKGFIGRTLDRNDRKSVSGSVFEVHVQTKPIEGRRINEVRISVTWPAASRHQRSIAAVTYLLDLPAKDLAYALQ